MENILQYTLEQFLKIPSFFTKDYIFILIVWFVGVYIIGFIFGMFFSTRR